MLSIKQLELAIGKIAKTLGVKENPLWIFMFIHPKLLVRLVCDAMKIDYIEYSDCVFLFIKTYVTLNDIKTEFDDIYSELRLEEKESREIDLTEVEEWLDMVLGIWKER